MKQCYSCKQFKEIEEFGSDKGKKDFKSTYCKFCARKRDKEYFILHKKSRYSQYKNRRVKIVQENARKIWEYLKNHPCVDCGEKDIIVLEFDHQRDKKYSISQMITNGLCWETIINEIVKCEVVCSNCHQRRTAKSQKWFKYIKLPL